MIRVVRHLGRAKIVGKYSHFQARAQARSRASPPPPAAAPAAADAAPAPPSSAALPAARVVAQSSLPGDVADALPAARVEELLARKEREVADLTAREEAAAGTAGGGDEALLVRTIARAPRRG